MAHTGLSKDMVDLAMKIKKHVRAKYDITVTLADPELLDKLVRLKNIDDPVLQGMLTYLMALAGPDWSAKFNNEDGTPSPDPEPTKEKKRLFGQYRGKPFSNKAVIDKSKPAQEKHDETVYRGQHLGEEEEKSEPEEKKKPVRYYRGQPIYD